MTAPQRILVEREDRLHRQQLVAADEAFLAALRAEYAPTKPATNIPENIPEPESEPVVIEQRPGETDAEFIIREVATAHEVSIDALKGPRHFASIVRARHEAMFRLKSELDLSLPVIGRLFGGRDHTTVMNALRKYEGQP